MYKFEINLLYNEEEFLGTNAGLFHFKITLQLAKLDKVVQSYY